MWPGVETSTEAAKEEEEAGSQALVRQYTEKVMDLLEKRSQAGQGQEEAREEDKLAIDAEHKWKKTAETETYWDSQYAAPDAMQHYGFCKTETQKFKYPSSHGSAAIDKPPISLDSHSAGPPTHDAAAAGITSHAEELIAHGASGVSFSSRRSSASTKPHITWEGLPEEYGKRQSRFLDEEEEAKKGEPVHVLDGRAAVRRTLVDDIETRRTLRKLSTLTALLEKKKTGEKKEDFHRLPRVAMVTLKARMRMPHRRAYTSQPPVLCQFPGACFTC